MLLLFYRINVAVSIPLILLVMYLIIYKSPKEMAKYKWLLLNIQVSAFVESLYWTNIFGVMVDVYPYIHIYPSGLLWTWFKTPVNISWVILADKIFQGLQAFETVCLGCVHGAIVAALLFRHDILIPLSPYVHIIPSFARKYSTPFTIIFTYIHGVACALAAVYGWLSAEETVEILQKADPNYEIMAGSMTFGGTDAYIWGGMQAVLLPVTIVSLPAIVIHCNITLKRTAMSAKSVKMHKEAIKSLLIMITLLGSSTAVPSSILAVGLAIGISYVPNFYIQLGYFSSYFFSAKSVFCSMAILWTTTHYRYTILRKIGLKKDVSVIVRSQTS